MSREFNNVYVIHKQLGSGTYGNVYEVENTRTGYLYACKVVKLRKDEFNSCVYNELIAWKTFHHPNIVKIIDVYCEATNNPVLVKEAGYVCYIIMEKCDCDFYKFFITDRTQLTLETKLLYLEQIMRGLTYMYKKGYMHNDLSLSNILIKYNDKRQPATNHIKLIDFGFIYKYTVKLTIYHTITEYIQPPELISGKMTDLSKVDTWSLGLIFYTIMYNTTLIRPGNREPLIRKYIYYFDLIYKVAVPSVDIIRQYDLVKNYVRIYNIFIKPESPVIIANMTDQAVNTMLYELRNYVTTKLPGTNYLLIESVENKFIKKLLNWNYNRRPDIIQANHLFSQLFRRQNGMVTIRAVKQPVPEYSYHELYGSFSLVKWLFDPNCIIPVSITQFFGDDYNLTVKTLHLICVLMNQGKNLKEICHVEDETDDVVMLFNNFNRFYLLTEVIYYHQDNYEMYTTADVVSLNDAVDKFQFALLRAIDCNVLATDAWDVFLENDIDKIYTAQFQFLYFITLNNYNLIMVNPKTIFAGIMTIILSYYDKVVNKCLHYEFNRINLMLEKSTKIRKCKSLKPSVNLAIINVHSIIISYYVIWIINEIDMTEYMSIVTKLRIGKKFIEHLDKLKTI